MRGVVRGAHQSGDGQGCPNYWYKIKMIIPSVSESFAVNTHCQVDDFFWQ